MPLGGNNGSSYELAKGYGQAFPYTVTNATNAAPFTTLSSPISLVGVTRLQISFFYPSYGTVGAGDFELNYYTQIQVLVRSRQVNVFGLISENYVMVSNRGSGLNNQIYMDEVQVSGISAYFRVVPWVGNTINGFLAVVTGH